MTALTIVAPQGKTLAQYYQQTSVVGNLFTLKMLASGGQTPYWWSFSGPAMAVVGGTTGTNYALPLNGWLSCAAVTAGADTFTVLVTDNNGATATQSVTITHTSSGITFYPLDLTSGSPVLNLPQAYASTSYKYQLKVAGGTGTGQVFSIASGALPSGLRLSSSGVILGSPLLPGSISNCQIKCVDSANNTQTVSLYMNVLSQNKVTRPAYNTGTGFFVDANGYLRDPIGNLFIMRGLDRVHYDSDSWAGPAAGALAYPSAVRVFMFDGQTAAFAANQVQTQYAPNNIFTILTLAGIGSLTPTGTTGQTNPAYITQATTDWISYFSALSPVMNSIAINIANEWGPSNSTSWRDTYITAVGNLRSAGYTCPFVIDTGSSGEDINDILNYSAAINNSDPLKNCIFSIHPYAAALPWEASIASVTKGNPTVLTLNSNWANFPLNPGASTAGTNNFNFEYQIIEAAGLPSLNGIFPSDNKTYGSQNNWQVHLTVDSTAWVGNYIANSAHIYLAVSTSSRNVDYRYMASQLAGLRSSGVCTIVGEFGPGNQSGNVLGATQQLNFQDTTPGQFIAACESNQIGYLSWAWDDHSGTNTLFTPNYFNMVYAVAPGYGKYTKPSDLTAFGLDIVGNPRYGTLALAEPAASFIPSDPTSSPRLTSSALSYLGCFTVPNTMNGVSLVIGGSSLAVNQVTTAGAVSTPDGVLYYGVYTFTGGGPARIGSVVIPTRAQIANWQVTVPAAGVAYTTTGSFPNTTGAAFGGDLYRQAGLLAWNGQLVYQQACAFDSHQGSNQLNSFGKASLDLTTVSPMIPATVLNGRRHTNQYMGVIPPEWRSLLGGPVLAGASVQSTFQNCTLGVSAYVFDPQNVINGVNPVPTTCAMDYVFISPSDWSKALGGTTPQVGWASIGTTANFTNGSTTMVVTAAAPATGNIIVGPVGSGSQICSGGDSVASVPTSAAPGVPVGATVISQQSGTPGQVGTYTLSAPATADLTGTSVRIGSVYNGYVQPGTQFFNGPFFPSGSRTVGFIGQTGTGPLTYRNPNETCGRPGGYGGQPYLRKVMLFDANDLLAVIQGANFYSPVPYSVFNLSVPVASPIDQTCSGCQWTGFYYDDTPMNGNPSRIYLTDGTQPGGKQYVHVFEVAH